MFSPSFTKNAAGLNECGAFASRELRVLSLAQNKAIAGLYLVVAPDTLDAFVSLARKSRPGCPSGPCTHSMGFGEALAYWQQQSDYLADVIDRLLPISHLKSVRPASATRLRAPRNKRHPAESPDPPTVLFPGKHSISRLR